MGHDCFTQATRTDSPRLARSQARHVWWYDGEGAAYCPLASELPCWTACRGLPTATTSRLAAVRLVAESTPTVRGRRPTAIVVAFRSWPRLVHLLCARFAGGEASAVSLTLLWDKGLYMQ